MNFGFYSSYVALWIWVIFQGLLTLAIFRQVLELEKRETHATGMSGGKSLVGARAPKFSGTDFRSGQPLNLNVFNGQGGVILFLAARCSVCRNLSRSLRDGVLESLPPIVAICTGDTKGVAKLGKRLAPQIPLLVDEREDATAVYKISGYPTAVVLDAERRIRAHDGISSPEDLKRLVALTTADDTNGEAAIAITPSGQNA